MLFQTTAAHEELRAKIRSFAEEEIKPLAFMMDQNNEFPEEAVKKLGKLGWMGIPFPKEYGGAGLDALSYAIAVEELARVDGGAGVILSAHVSLGSWPIFAYGTAEQKKKYLVPLAKGEKIGAFGLTEPNAGSDAGGTETTALDKGDYYLLNGGKIFITNAPKEIGRASCSMQPFLYGALSNAKKFPYCSVFWKTLCFLNVRLQNFHRFSSLLLLQSLLLSATIARNRVFRWRHQSADQTSGRRSDCRCAGR